MKSSFILQSRSAFQFLFLTVFFLTSCQKEPTPFAHYSCTPTLAQDQKNHPDGPLFQALLDKYVRQGLPGLVLLVKDPQKGTWVGSSGYASLEEKAPLQPCSLMYSASVGKIYCATAVMLLMEDGLLEADAPIQTYLPKDLCEKLPNGKSATVRQLLNHTSGIPNVDDDKKFGTALLNNPLSLTNEKILSFIYGQKPDFPAGTRYHYSSTGYELLSLIIDRVSGQPHAQFYTQRIFKPLGLNHTYYKNEPEFPLPNGTVNSYFERFGNGKLENVSRVNNHLNSVLSGSDGIIATAMEYGTFLESLMEGKLVAKSTLNAMSWAKVDMAPNTFYGYGMYLRPSPYGEYV